MMLNIAKIKAHPTTVKKPQANEVCKRLHKTCVDVIHTTTLWQPAGSMGMVIKIVNTFLVMTQKALQTFIHWPLRVSPGALGFYCFMLLSVPKVRHYKMMQQR